MPRVRSHRQPVPYLGGAGLIVGWVAIVALLGAPGPDTWLRIATALAFVAFGTWDDLRPFGPTVKLVVQVAICAAYLAWSGTPPGLTFAWKLLALATVVNAFNLIDVMDGLLCLVSAIAVAGLLFVPGLAPDALRPELIAMLAGLCALFFFNRPPARIYAGDAGSLTLGFLVGAWLLHAADHLPAPAGLSLVGLVAAPAIELPLLVVARLSRGLSPPAPGPPGMEQVGRVGGDHRRGRDLCRRPPVRGDRHAGANARRRRRRDGARARDRRGALAHSAARCGRARAPDRSRGGADGGVTERSFRFD